jgi:hypothetical protein
MGFGAIKFIPKSSIMTRLYPSYRTEFITVEILGAEKVVVHALHETVYHITGTVRER